jgi:anti-sigma B factor antagonist
VAERSVVAASTVLRSGFHVQVDVADDEVAVVVLGELDAHIAPALTDVVIERCGERTVHVRIDATGLSFIDSAGIQTLVRVLRHVRRHGGDLSVVGASRAVRRVLDITGVATLSGASVP